MFGGPRRSSAVLGGSLGGARRSLEVLGGSLRFCFFSVFTFPLIVDANPFKRIVLVNPFKCVFVGAKPFTCWLLSPGTLGRSL